MVSRLSLFRIALVGVIVSCSVLLYTSLPAYNAGLFRSHGQADHWLEALRFQLEYHKAEYVDSNGFPHAIDIVYTWVNGSHPRQKKGLLELKRLTGSGCNESVENCTTDDATANRYQDNNEMLYSMRSIEKFCPWARRIYLVTNGQVPSWLNLNHPRLKLVTHTQIFTNQSHLPCFSSPAIEANLKNIPGLADYFVYLNDDVMFGDDIWPSDFMTRATGQRVYTSWPVPDCAEGCISSWLKDGFCDVVCNNSACHYDHGDCNATTNQQAAFQQYGYHQGYQGLGRGNEFALCSESCPSTWIGDKFCDNSCNNEKCGMDGGDCKLDEVYSNLYGVELVANESRLYVPDNLASLYFNLSSLLTRIAHDDYSTKVFGTTEAELKKVHVKVVTGQHNNSLLIRASIIRQKSHTMVVLLDLDDPARKKANVTFSIYMDYYDEAPTPIRGECFVQFYMTFYNESNATEKKLHGSADEDSDETSENENLAPPPIANEAIDESDETVDAENFTERLESLNEVIQVLIEENAKEETDSGGENTVDSTAPNNSDSEPATTRTQNTDEKEAEIVANATGGFDFDFDGFLRNLTKREEMALSKGGKSFRSRLVVDAVLRERLKDSMKRRGGKFVPGRFNRTQGSRYNRTKLNNARNRMRRSKKKKQNTASTGGPDYYGDSLKFTDNMLSSAFGFEKRNVPAHMAHFIQKKVLEDCQTHWAKEWDATSSSQLRSSTDIQFAHAYYYFMAEERVEYNWDEIWKSIDKNNDGYLNLNEIRSLLMVLHEGSYEKDEDYNERLQSFITCRDDVKPNETASATNFSNSTSRNSTTEANGTTTAELEFFDTTNSSAVVDSSNESNSGNLSVNATTLEETSTTAPECALKSDEMKSSTITEIVPSNVSEIETSSVGSGKEEEKNEEVTATVGDVNSKSSDESVREEISNEKNNFETRQNLPKSFEFDPRPIYVSRNSHESIRQEETQRFFSGDVGSEDIRGNESELDESSMTGAAWERRRQDERDRVNGLDHFLNTAKDASFIFIEGKLPLALYNISKADLESCKSEMENIKKAFKNRKKRKSLIINEDPQVAFVMVDNDFAEMRKKFDGIRNFRHKFICLNDNMNHNEKDSMNSVQVLNDFYESLVPLPSEFELPRGVENPELYLDDLNNFHQVIYFNSMCYLIGVAVSIFLLALSLVYPIF